MSLEGGPKSENTSMIVNLTIWTLLIYPVDDLWHRRLELVTAGHSEHLA